MSIIVAYTTDTYIPQGTDRDIRMEILTEADNPFDLTGHKVYMAFSSMRTGEAPVLQKEAEIVVAANGTVIFKFTPEDTVNLLSIAYSADVWVVETVTDYKWLAWSGRIGVTSIVPLEEVKV